MTQLQRARDTGKTVSGEAKDHQPYWWSFTSYKEVIMTKAQIVHALLTEATKPKYKDDRMYRKLLKELYVNPETDFFGAQELLMKVPTVDLGYMAQAMFNLNLVADEYPVEFNTNKPFGDIMEDIYDEIDKCRLLDREEMRNKIYSWCISNLAGKRLYIAVCFLKGTIPG